MSVAAASMPAAGGRPVARHLYTRCCAALSKASLVLAIVGLGVEGLAVMAMVFYPIRRRLPNPFVVQSAGFGLFVLGLFFYAIGSTHVSD